MEILAVLKVIVSILWFAAVAAVVAIAIAAVIFKITGKLDKKRNKRLTIAFLVSLVSGFICGISHFMIAFQMYNM